MTSKKWFKSHRATYEKLTQMKYGQRTPHLTSRQMHVRDNFLILAGPHSETSVIEECLEVPALGNNIQSTVWQTIPVL